jgi:CBS domain-containing protein
MARAPNTIGEMMTKDVVTVGPDDIVRKAIQAMDARDIGAVVVVRGPVPVGVFTERDPTRRLLDEPTVLDRNVGDVMSSPPVVTSPEAEMVAAFDLMNANRIRRLPVVKADDLVGIVTERDLLQWVGQVARE